MKRRSKIQLLLLLFTISAFAVPASGEVINVRKEVRQLLGSAMSRDDARIAAIALAKRLALEEAIPPRYPSFFIDKQSLVCSNTL